MWHAPTLWEMWRQWPKDHVCDETISFQYLYYSFASFFWMCTSEKCQLCMQNSDVLFSISQAKTWWHVLKKQTPNNQVSGNLGLLVTMYTCSLVHPGMWSPQAVFWNWGKLRNEDLEHDVLTIQKVWFPHPWRHFRFVSALSLMHYVYAVPVTIHQRSAC